MNGASHSINFTSSALAGDTPSAVQKEAAEVIDEYSAEIMKLPGVWAVGDYADPNNGTVAIRIKVSKLTPELRAIPPVLGGFVVVIDVGSRPVDLLQVSFHRR